MTEIKKLFCADDADHSKRSWLRYLFFSILILLGVAGNLLRFQIFLNIDFIFGSIFSLLILQFFGLQRGIIAAALISSVTFHLWNHPYACLILTGEVAVVGWLYPRRKVGMVLADTLYWLVIGMPLVYFFYHEVMNVPWDATSIVMVKQAVNGIGNALIARALFASSTFVTRSNLLPFREILSTIIGLFVLIPALTTLATNSRSDFLAVDQYIRTKLLHDSNVISDSLKTWLKNREVPITYLAKMAVHTPPQDMQHHLEQALLSDHNFQRIAELDKIATIVAFAPPPEASGSSNLGKNFADRPFIPKLKRDLKPMLSEVVIARVGPPLPVVHMLAPIVTPAGYNGFIVGALNLDRIEKIFALDVTSEGQFYALTDRNGNIISTNIKDQKVLHPRERGTGKLYDRGGRVEQWIPELPANTPIMEQWKRSCYSVSTTIDDLSAWTLTLEQPVLPFQKQLYASYSRKFIFLFVLLILVLFCAEILSRLITRPGEELLALTSRLPESLSGRQSTSWPTSSVLETKRLIENFSAMSARLVEQFSAIRMLNLSLEERVHLRTQELEESRERYDLALLGSQDGIWDWNVRTNQVYYSARYLEMLGYEAGEREQTFAFFEELVHPDDLPLIHEAVEKHFKERVPYRVEFRIRKKDGDYLWILARGQALWDDYGQPLRMAGSHTDISLHKKSKELILAALHEKEVLLKEIHHRVKNNLQIIQSLLTLQVRDISDNQILALFDESRNRISSMALIHENLYNSENLSCVDFSTYLKDLADNISSIYQRPEIKVTVGGERLCLDINAGIPCGLIVNELVTNSYKYAFPQGRSGAISISLILDADGERCLLTVEDNGVGLPDGLNFSQATTLGLQLVRVLAEQLQAELELTSAAGVRFCFNFPFHPVDKDA